VINIRVGDELELRFVQGASRKFWGIEVKKESSDSLWFVDIRWGRIGTKGQWKRYRHTTQLSAILKARALINGKLKKGYKEYSRPDFAMQNVPRPETRPETPRTFADDFQAFLKDSDG